MNNITQTVFTISRISFNKFVSAFGLLILLLVVLSSYGQITYTWNGTSIASTSGSNAKIMSEAFTSQKGDNNVITTLRLISSFHNKTVTLKCYVKQFNFILSPGFEFKS